MFLACCLLLIPTVPACLVCCPYSDHCCTPHWRSCFVNFMFLLVVQEVPMCLNCLWLFIMKFPQLKLLVSVVAVLKLDILYHMEISKLCKKIRNHILWNVQKTLHQTSFFWQTWFHPNTFGPHLCKTSSSNSVGGGINIISKCFIFLKVVFVLFSLFLKQFKMFPLFPPTLGKLEYYSGYRASRAFKSNNIQIPSMCNMYAKM